MSNNRIILVALVLALVSAECLALSIGSAPGVYDLHELAPGEEKEFKFYLTTNSASDILVTLTHARPHSTIYQNNQTGRYRFIVGESSNHDPAEWLTLKRNPIVVSPSNTYLVKLENGGIVRANAIVDAVIRVPKDAEPCYYVGSLAINPDLKSMVGSMGFATIGVTRFLYVFKVSGEARRTGEIIDIEAIRESKDKVRIDTLFKNTGSCTIKPWVKQSNLYGVTGNVTFSGRSSNREVKPNGIVILSTYMVGDTARNLNEGSYRVDSLVDYYTNTAYHQKQVFVSKVPVIKVPKEDKKKECGFPWGLPLIVVIVSLAAYTFNLIARKKIKSLTVAGLVIAFAAGAVYCPSETPWDLLLISAIIILAVKYFRGK